jgi:alpha-tubulin suppressor-like RCC1 family protein
MVGKIAERFRQIRVDGFAMPTVMITSVVMLIVLMASLQTSASMSTNLNESYYTRLAKEATESGLLFANECLNNGHIWRIKLKTGTNCDGNAITGASSYIVNKTASNLVRSSYEVNALSASPFDSNGQINITVQGKVELLRGSSGTRVWRTITDTSRALGSQSAWTDIDGGYYNYCGVKAGKVYCWGNNSSGQLGNGSSTGGSTNLGSSVPVPVQGLEGKRVISVDVGGFKRNGVACAITSDYQLYCWGYNKDYIVSANSTQTVYTTAVKRTGFPTGAQIRDVSIGWTHACAIVNLPGSTILDHAYCWGKNSDSTSATVVADSNSQATSSETSFFQNGGQIGTGSSLSAHVNPSSVESSSGPLQNKRVQLIAAGATHTCAVTTDNVVTCWGDNQITDSPATITYGVFGNGSTVSQQNVPSTAISTLWNRVTDISAGYKTTCAITSETGRCWGLNSGTDLSQGQLGDGTSTNKSTPTSFAVPHSNTTLKKISTSYGHTCAVTTGGAVYCWGVTRSGRVGNGHSAAGGAVLLPTLIYQTTGLTNEAAFIEVAVNSSCAFNTTGAAWCWGEGAFGAIGNNQTSDAIYASPVNTTSLPLDLKRY